MASSHLQTTAIHPRLKTKKGGFQAEKIVKPATNILEKESGYTIQLAVLGLQKEDVKLNLAKNVLTITAEKEVPSVEGATFNIKEFDYARFKRTFVLPESIDVQNIRANYTNDILTVTLLKAAPAKPTVTQIMVA